MINETIDELKDHVEERNILNKVQLEKQLDILISELVKSTPHKVLAGKLKTQDYLLKLIEAEIDEKEDSRGENSVSFVSDL